MWVGSTSSALTGALGLFGARNGSTSTRALAVGELEGGVAEIADVHGEPPSVGSGRAAAYSSPEAPRSSRASSQPTATPTSIPMRASSASSVRKWISRSSRILQRRHAREPLLVRGVEPAALGERAGQHLLELRRGRGHAALDLPEAAGVAERLEGGAQLLVGEALGHEATVAARR